MQDSLIVPQAEAPTLTAGRLKSALRAHGVFGLIFLFAIFLVTLNLHAPFQGRSGQNSVIFVGFAANHVRHGLDFTHGQDWWADTEMGVFPLPTQIPDVFDRYLNGETSPRPYGDHPPLIGLTEAAVMELFGADYALMRVAPILFTLAGLVLFYLLLRRLFDQGIAILGAFLYAVFPISAYYGQMIGHEAPTLFWGLAMMTGYVHWCDGTGRRRRWWAVLTVVSIVVGGGYGWPAFYLAGIIFAFDWLWRRRFDLKLLLLTIVPAVLTGAAVIGHIAWAFGGLDHLWAVAMHRSSELGDVTLLGWLRAQAVFALRNYGIMTAALSPIVGFFVASRVRAERFSLRTMVIAAFAVWGLAHVLLFRNGSYIHDYWQYYLTPFMAAGLAWLLTAMARRLLPSALPRAALLLVLCAGVLLGNVPQIISHYGTTLEWTRTGVESPLFPFNSRNWHAESLARRAAPGCLNRAPTPALCRRRAATTLGALFLSLGRGLGLRWRRRG